jgi:phosphoglycerate dehydrogenase-like enzyme
MEAGASIIPGVTPRDARRICELGGSVLLLDKMGSKKREEGHCSKVLQFLTVVAKSAVVCVHCPHQDP